MKRSISAPNRTWFTVLDSLLSMVAMFMGLRIFIHLAQILRGTADFDGAEYTIMAALFFCIALELGLRAWYLGRQQRKAQMILLVRAGLALLSCIAMLSLGYTELAGILVIVFYVASLVLDRLDSIRRYGNRRSTVLNIVAIVMLILVFILADDQLALCLLFIFVQYLGHIIAISFANINLRALRKIIRKTYAAEILFGMLLLIVAFSLILPTLEPDIHTFQDALWYCFAIVTTIGFGDIAATGIIGRILSIILGIYGIIVVSLITSVIVNFYLEVRNEKDEEDEKGADCEHESESDTDRSRDGG